MPSSRVIQVGQVPLVFGLEWIPLLDDTGSASSVARRQGASHRVLSGNPPAALGLAHGLPRGPACWSAATLMACQHPAGTVAWLFPLDGECWHVLACHEGVALARADRSYPDRALAREAIDALRLSHPYLEVREASTCPPEAGEQADCLREAARIAGSAPPLQPVRRFSRAWLWGAGLASTAALVGVPLWPAAGVAEAPELAARAAWEQALEDTLARRPVHGVDGTRELLAAFHRQPVRLAGWSLQTLRCEAAAGSRPWQCVAEYRRGQAGADNRGLMQAAPAEWRLDFPSLDRARVHWPLTLAARSPDPRDLPVSRMLARDWASALQKILPAFSRLQVEPARALVLVAPRDSQGRERPAPPGLPAVATRALHVQGPLRSAALLAPLAQAVAWQKAVLDVAPGARVGVRGSRLVLHLEGIVYENA
ncbi:Type 4b pilus protein PilO2 OS=Castellaniella defragrans OX=75697 GN=HNR28_001963 PE=4 SV=1 [Castellaniella defragrans]